MQNEEIIRVEKSACNKVFFTKTYRLLQIFDSRKVIGVRVALSSVDNRETRNTNKTRRAVTEFSYKACDSVNVCVGMCAKNKRRRRGGETKTRGGALGAGPNIETAPCISEEATLMALSLIV